MPRVRVETDGGELVALWQDDEPEDGELWRRWHGPVLPHFYAPASGGTNLPGFRRSLANAKAIEQGRDPERPSEKVMRLTHGGTRPLERG